MEEDAIRDFWNANPCGAKFVGEPDTNHLDFFERYDAYRYATEHHIPNCLDEIDFNGKKVLEIGFGLGADAEQIIRRGGVWSGLELSSTAAERTRYRFRTKNLQYEEIKLGSILDCPFDDNQFDIVISHGVLHHVPDIQSAQKEVHRVIKKDGKLVVMLYARNSLNYMVSIRILRRLALLILYVLDLRIDGILAGHLENSKKMGIFNYLTMRNFIHVNTDGPHNPYSKVYDNREIVKDFPSFDLVSTKKLHMHAPPLPINRLPGGSLMGWHLWAILIPR